MPTSPLETHSSEAPHLLMKRQLDTLLAETRIKRSRLQLVLSPLQREDEALAIEEASLRLQRRAQKLLDGEDGSSDGSSDERVDGPVADITTSTSSLSLSISVILQEWSKPGSAWLLIRPSGDTFVHIASGCGDRQHNIVEEMQMQMDQGPTDVLYGLLRMSFGTGRLARTHHISTCVVGESSSAMLWRTCSAARKYLDRFAPTRIELPSLRREEFGLKTIVEKVSQAVHLDNDHLVSISGFHLAWKQERAEREDTAGDDDDDADDADDPAGEGAAETGAKNVGRAGYSDSEKATLLAVSPSHTPTYVYKFYCSIHGVAREQSNVLKKYYTLHGVKRPKMRGPASKNANSSSIARPRDDGGAELLKDWSRRICEGKAMADAAAEEPVPAKQLERYRDILKHFLQMMSETFGNRHPEVAEAHGAVRELVQKLVPVLDAAVTNVSDKLQVRKPRRIKEFPMTTRNATSSARWKDPDPDPLARWWSA